MRASGLAGGACRADPFFRAPRSAPARSPRNASDSRASLALPVARPERGCHPWRRSAACRRTHSGVRLPADGCLRASSLVATRDERNCHHSVALSVLITLDRCAARLRMPSARRAHRRLVAIVGAWAEDGFRRSAYARGNCRRNVALAVLHREGVGCANR